MLDYKIGLEINRLASFLRVYASTKDLCKGRLLHESLIKTVMEEDRYLANLFVQMYGKCGALWEARSIFDHIQCPNSFSWNIMIASYAEHGLVNEAIHVFEQMPKKDVVSWNAVLAIYCQQGQLEMAFQVFFQMPQHDQVSWNTIVAAYAKKGSLQQALYLFRLMPVRNVVSWNIMLTAYGQHSNLKETMVFFKQMPEHNLVSWTAMITAYGNHAHLEEALQLFEQMPERDLISWNALILAYAKHGFFKEAFYLFQQMPERNLISWTLVVLGFAQQGHLDEAIQLFWQMPQRDVMSWNTMITAYAQHGHVHKALHLFQQMPRRDIVSWNALISGYAHQAYLDDALKLFQQMQLENTKPDRITLVIILDACASMAAIAEGKQIHAYIFKTGFQLDNIVGTALVHMYGKCGNLQLAYSVFQSLPKPSEILWNSMIAVYAQHGRITEMLKTFQDMQVRGMMADEVTFSSILSAYSHLGLADEGHQTFVSMVQTRQITPTLQHYNCIIDLVGRSGKLDLADAFVNSMPIIPNATSWKGLLASCRGHLKPQLGREIANQVLQLNPGDATTYVLLSNICASVDDLNYGKRRDADLCKLSTFHNSCS